MFGDIVGVYNNDDYKLITYEYDAWGNVLLTYHNNGEYTTAVKNPFLYRGYYYDSDLDLYYLNSRYYDSAIGRFISPDDVSYLGANGDLNSYNLYAYCSNNPVMYTDPSGHSIIAVLFFAVVIGAVVGSAISIGKELIDGNFNPLDWDWKNIIGSACVGAAISVATAAGGLAGIGAVSGWATVGLFAGNTALSFGAGAAQYSLNYSDTDEFSLSGLLIDATLTAVQSMTSFGIGAVMGSSGMWNSLNKGEFSKSFSSFRNQGNNLTKSFFMATRDFVKNNVAQIIERAFVRNVFTIPYTISKTLI